MVGVMNWLGFLELSDWLDRIGLPEKKEPFDIITDIICYVDNNRFF